MLLLWKMCMVLVLSLASNVPPADPKPTLQVGKAADGKCECTLSLGARKVWRTSLPQCPEFIDVHRDNFIAFGCYGLGKKSSLPGDDEYWIVTFSIDSDGVVNELWRKKSEEWVGSVPLPRVEGAFIDSEDVAGLLMLRESPGGPLLIKRFSLAALVAMPDVKIIDDRLKGCRLVGAKCLDKSPLLILVWWVGTTRNASGDKGASEFIQVVNGSSGLVVWSQYAEGAWGLEPYDKLRASWTDVNPLIKQNGEELLIRKGAAPDSSKWEWFRITIKGDRVDAAK